MKMNSRKGTASVDTCALLSLKAELYRKQAEMKIKQTLNSDMGVDDERHNNSSNQKEMSVEESTSKIYDSMLKTRHVKRQPFVKDSSSKIASNQPKRSKKKRSDREKNLCDTRIEDSAMLQKSKRILQQKAKLYDQWRKSGGYLNSDDNCLVMFNKKSQEENQTIKNELKSNENNKKDYDSDNDDDNDSFEDDDDDDIVEFIDCLGRTRKCLRKELADYLKRDNILAAEMPKRLEQQNPVNSSLTKSNCSEPQAKDDLNSLSENNLTGECSNSNERFKEDINDDSQDLTKSKLEQQRINWEKKMNENLNKTDVHYQDVFFDEARQHGVGYYAFSTDEEERRRQQRELTKLHQDTLEAQQTRESVLEQRQSFINERILAAKNKVRARQGLPPLEKEEPVANIEDDSAKMEKKRNDVETWRKQLHEEFQKEMQRQQHIRPWDVDKLKEKENDNIDESTDTWKYKPEREPMSQEQWLEYKRKERPDEFAPPSTYK